MTLSKTALNVTKQNDTQQNDIKHNVIWHNGIQNCDNKPNDTALWHSAKQQTK